MEPRFHPEQLSRESYRALYQLELTLQNSSIELPLRELVKLRASQLNQCAFCIDMHWKDARAGGESEQRLYGLSAWEESPYYTQRERAALRWTEAVTHLHTGGVSDAVYAEVSQQLSEQEISDLTAVIVTINAWNRFAIASRAHAGDYQAQAAHA
ncbi:MAG: carboxymuconolactone decarboxylase family protein, partial [Phycisphaerales bacterium]